MVQACRRPARVPEWRQMKPHQAVTEPSTLGGATARKCGKTV